MVLKDMGTVGLFVWFTNNYKHEGNHKAIIKAIMGVNKEAVMILDGIMIL